MISFVETGGRRSSPQIYELEVVLDSSKPRIWRRLRVPGEANLGWLHAVLQVAMGWTNSHLHQFICDKIVYTDLSIGWDHSEGMPPIAEEADISLAAIVPRKKDRLAYEYDFGDSWRHTITVTDISSSDSCDIKTAQCLAGKLACPPEDCGGLWGYYRMLKAIKNRKHPDHKPLKEWIGRSFDPSYFDVRRTNFWLGKLKWPRVTEARLRKVLMARDGYCA